MAEAAAFQRDLGRLEGRVESLEKALSSHELRTNARLSDLAENIDRRFTALETQNRGLDEKLDALALSFGAVRAGARASLATLAKTGSVAVIAISAGAWLFDSAAEAVKAFMK